MFVELIGMLFKIPDLDYNYNLMDTILELGKNLCSINLLIASETGLRANYSKPTIDFIIEGCPKLKNLTLESLRGWKKSAKPKLSRILSNLGYNFKDIHGNWTMEDFYDISISKASLEALYKSCKELKDLKLTKIDFVDILTEDEIKKILPNCNVEIKECHYLDDPNAEDDSDSDDM